MNEGKWSDDEEKKYWSDESKEAALGWERKAVFLLFPKTGAMKGAFSCCRSWRRRMDCSTEAHCSILFVLGNNCPIVD